MEAYERSFGAKRHEVTHAVLTSLPVHSPQGKTRINAG
jgi:hypothetical protein